MRIANLRSWRTNSGGSRVEADIDGELLWFDSGDAPLTPSPEGFASALLIAAATRGEPIEVDAAVDRSWLEQVPGIVRQVKQWWQLPGTRVIAAGVVDAPRATPGVTAQCFTGGVDLFYALITAKASPGCWSLGTATTSRWTASVRLYALSRRLPRDRCRVRHALRADCHQSPAAPRYRGHRLAQKPWRRPRRIGPLPRRGGGADRDPVELPLS